MSQFGTIKLSTTFKNYFGQFVWIEKKSHYISRVSLHEAPTKKGDKKSQIILHYSLCWELLEFEYSFVGAWRHFVQTMTYSTIFSSSF